MKNFVERISAVVLMILLVLSVSPAIAMGPSVSFAPSSVDPGATTKASGMGFLPGEKVWINWDHPPVRLAELVADQEGHFEADFQVPGDSGEAVHRVVLAGDKGSSVVATLRVGNVKLKLNNPEGVDEQDGQRWSIAYIAGALVLGLLLGAVVGRRIGRS